jgi:hypothetical protein
VLDGRREPCFQRPHRPAHPGPVLGKRLFRKEKVEGLGGCCLLGKGSGLQNSPFLERWAGGGQPSWIPLGGQQRSGISPPAAAFLPAETSHSRRGRSMLSRRRWFAAAGSLAAGLFALPGKAVAGVFRRGRCQAPCPPVEDSNCLVPSGDGVVGLPEIPRNCTVNINPPSTTSPISLPANAVTVSGTASCTPAGPTLAVVCMLTSGTPSQNLYSGYLSVTGGTWGPFQFSGVQAANPATLSAILYSVNTTGTAPTYSPVTNAPTITIQITPSC